MSKISKMKQLNVINVDIKESYHSTISNNFWIFPQNILFEKKIISNYDENNKKTEIYVKLSEEKGYLTNEWIKKYEYNYLSIDKELLLSIF